MVRSGQAGPGWEEARVGMWGWGDWLTPPSQALGPEARSWSWAVREKGLECQPQPGTQRARPFLPLLPSLPTSSPPPRPPPRWECLGWTPLARSPRRWCPPPLPGLRGRRRPPHTPHQQLLALFLEVAAPSFLSPALHPRSLQHHRQCWGGARRGRSGTWRPGQGQGPCPPGIRLRSRGATVAMETEQQREAGRAPGAARWGWGSPGACDLFPRRSAA